MARNSGRILIASLIVVAPVLGFGGGIAPAGADNVTGSVPGAEVAAPIGSTPVVPSAVPVLSAAPLVGLHEGTWVHLDGSGFPPSALVATARQCVNGGACDTTFGFDVEADASGNVVDATFRLKRDISAGGATVACDAAPDDCAVVVGSFNFPLSFSLPRESIVYSPTTNIVDGQSVTLHAADFEPGRYVLTTQCATADGDPAHCLNDHPVVTGKIGDDGTFQQDGHVVRMLTTPSGVVDCAAQTCYLASEDVSYYATRWIVPLAFAPIPPTTTTTTPGAALATTGTSSGQFAILATAAAVMGLLLLRVSATRSRPSPRRPRSRST